MADRHIAPSSTAVAVRQRQEAPDEHHVTCCRDDDLTLCGFDASALDWTEETTTCVVCADLEGCDACPFGGVCP